ncbi:TPM domain-containing protein [Anabaena cylindrica UHCC 0172]|uniref:photosystem II repair protein Psb32 n=1 Tax=Anabaena cylindrica TaxID=1165 RepID=UPI002B20DA59|nr:TPM domain-containing protein [Anabaena cylindrica]MEA5554757.1 TPM domain-containing protein [Anabaena cylindrica UHCC 0172]
MKQLFKPLFSMQKYFIRLILPLMVMMMASSLFAVPALATGVYQIPNLTPDTWIVDQGDVISRFNEGQISSAFKELAKETGNEVRIVTVHRLDYGETSASFAKGLFEKWFPTPEAQTNQSLLVIDTVTNNAAIISGDQVKSTLTDSIANSVAEETLGVPLRNGNKYNQAFVDVSDRLVAVISGQPDPGPPKVVENIQVEGTFTKAEDTDQGNATAWVVGLLIAATVIPMATYYIYQINQPSNEA